MPVMMSHAVSGNQSIYQSTVQDAAARGSLLMGKLVTSARASLQAREAACKDLRERDLLAQSAKHLRNWESELCKRFPLALLEAFSNPDAAHAAVARSVADVAFDELELMDEVQVLTSVTLARTQQVALLAAEASLTELNTLICTTLGLGAVNPERNPLRPQIYVHALRGLVEKTQLPPAIQLDWLGAMSVTLGQELRAMYGQLSQALRAQGVVAAGYAVTQTHAGPGIGRGVAQDLGDKQVGHHHVAHSLPNPGAGAGRIPQYVHPIPREHHAPPFVNEISGKDATLLTLDKLRRLLAGELDEPTQLSPKEQFARRFAQEFERDSAPAEERETDFDATVPAALEALTEMKQVDAVVQRLQRRRAQGASPIRDNDQSIDAVRTSLRHQAKGVGQALSLEVITMMVDNIAQDARLLPPVQELIRRLEPALLQLALLDPRLFTNKQHPARLLVQEVAQNSLAYLSVHAYGFAEYVHGVGETIAPLIEEPVESAEPFERALGQLQIAWQRAAQAGDRSRAAAMLALQNAEARNVLAEKIGAEIVAHPDAAAVPELVTNFLCGPWAQVVAQSRIAGPSGAAAAEKYQALISAMLWSTHPELSRKNTPKLTRLVPRLLMTLREGLETIHYPVTRTSAFLEALMGLHQLAFRSAPKVQAVQVAAPPTAIAINRSKLLEDGNPWVAPEEARASNFMDLPDAPGELLAVTPNQSTPHSGADLSTPNSGPEVRISDLPLGSWVELRVNEQWTRTQLSWASPHGTLFLFTGVAGATQSMTRRSADRLAASGQLRVISSQPVVDGALNAVAQVAMRNSVNTMQ
jgi:hypothetical protein